MGGGRGNIWCFSRVECFYLHCSTSQSLNNSRGATITASANSPAPHFHFSHCNRALSDSFIQNSRQLTGFTLPITTTMSPPQTQITTALAHLLSGYGAVAPCRRCRAGGTAVKMGQCQPRTPSATRSQVSPLCPPGAAAAGDHPQSVRRVQPRGQRRGAG